MKTEKEIEQAIRYIKDKTDKEPEPEGFPGILFDIETAIAFLEWTLRSSEEDKDEEGRGA